MTEKREHMPEKVLIYSRFPKAMMVRIGQRYDLMDAAGKSPNEVFSADQLAGVRAMITAGGTALGGDKMDMLPALQAIVCYGTGYDGVDLAAAASRKIVVGNSPAANAASVADIAMTLMLAVTRRLLPADDYVRSGNWSGAKPSPLMRPQPGNPGRRIGVYGMGEIGRRIAARAAAFEMDVAYYSRSQHDVPYRYVAEPRSAGGMVQRADDRGPRRRRYPSHDRCRRCCKSSGRTAISSIFRAAP